MIASTVSLKNSCLQCLDKTVSKDSVISKIHGKLGKKSQIEYINSQFIHNSGFTPHELLGKNMKVIKSGLHPKEFYHEMWETITSGSIWAGKIINRKKNGDLFWDSTKIIFHRSG